MTRPEVKQMQKLYSILPILVSCIYRLTLHSMYCSTKVNTISYYSFGSQLRTLSRISFVIIQKQYMHHANEYDDCPAQASYGSSRRNKFLNPISFRKHTLCTLQSAQRGPRDLAFSGSREWRY